MYMKPLRAKQIWFSSEMVTIKLNNNNHADFLWLPSSNNPQNIPQTPAFSFQWLIMLEDQWEPSAPSRAVLPADQRNPTETRTCFCLKDKCVAISMNNKSSESSLVWSQNTLGACLRDKLNLFMYSCLVGNSLGPV